MERKIVKSVKIKKVSPQNVYNLEVEGNNNYFANGILVHNCDDPNLVSIKKNQVEADAKRVAVNEWFSGAWVTRFNDPKKDVNIVSQQRTHEQDLSGYIMALEDKTNQEWTKLILPMEFEVKRKCKTIFLPSNNEKKWEDPRKEEGELLWPAYIGKKEVDRLKRGLGNEYRVAGQLQQRPSPAEGHILKKEWFKWWKNSKAPKFTQIIQSWDTALSDKDFENNAYHACTTWGLFEDDNKITNIILLGLWRGRCGYPELRERAKRLYADYRDDGIDPPKIKGLYQPDLVIVEEKASGYSLIQDFRVAGIAALKFNPNKYGDKITRVQRITHMIEAVLVWVPARPPEFIMLKSFADLFLELCAVFPNSEARDVVDTFTQVLLRLSVGGYIRHPKDENMSYGVNRPQESLYGYGIDKD